MVLLCSAHMLAFRAILLLLLLLDVSCRCQGTAEVQLEYRPGSLGLQESGSVTVASDTAGSIEYTCSGKVRQAAAQGLVWCACRFMLQLSVSPAAQQQPFHAVVCTTTVSSSCADTAACVHTTAPELLTATCTCSRGLYA